MLKTKTPESLFDMNKKEKDKVEFLKQFVRENYYLFCENKIFDFGYKTQQA